MVLFPVPIRVFSPDQGIKTRSGYYPIGTRSSFRGGKTAAAWRWPPTSIQCHTTKCPPPLAWCSTEPTDFTWKLLRILTTQLPTFRKNFSKKHPRRNILGDCNLDTHCREKFKYKVLYWYAFIIARACYMSLPSLTLIIFFFATEVLSVVMKK